MTDATFAPYEVIDSGRSVDEVFAQVNEAVWYGYGPDYRVGGATKIVAGPEFDFVSLLRDLTSLPRVRFVAHHEFLAEPCGDHEVRIAIRHDIDTDIVAASHQAQIEADFGVVANWVVLHTAPYYGAVDEQKRFVRNDSMIEVYRRFQDLGHEVSIHSDPLGLYQFHDIDGADGFTTELAWLRRHGIEVRGSTAHNHRPTYGAENFEIFTGYLAPAPNAQPLDATSVTHRGKQAPLRILDERELGLEYEGNQAFWNEELAIEYGSARFSNLWFWADHRRRRNLEPQLLDREFLDQRRMVEQIANLPGGSNLVLVVHPEYFGARSGVDQPPVRSLNRTETAHDAAVAGTGLGWRTWQPWSVVATADSTGDDQTRQAVNVANEWGMLDLPVDGRPLPERRIVFAGGTNVDGASVAVPSQFPARIELLGTDRLSQVIDQIKVAHPAMAIDRLWDWIKAVAFAPRTEDDPAPDTVVIGVTPSLDGFGLDNWNHAAQSEDVQGLYLGVDDNGGVHECTWPVQRHVSPPEWASVLACLRWVIETLWAAEIRTVLLVEGDGGVGAAAWTHDPRRRTLQSLTATTGALLVDPTLRIAAETERLDDPIGADGVWNATAHRVASEELFAALFPHATPAEFTSNYERRREATAGALGLLPPASALGAATPTAIDEHAERLEALGICTYPTPFESAISIVGDVDGSSTPIYNEYMGYIVGDLGLDHGDSIHLAGYHQRYSRGRRGLAMSIRAILAHDLRRDNAAIDDGECWFAHLLAEYHRGNIDHLHGLYAWGARTLPLTVVAGDTAQTRLASPFEQPGAVNGSREPFAFDAEYFPLISVVIETTAKDLPPSITPSFAPPAPRPDDPDAGPVQQRRPAQLTLATVRELSPATADEPATRLATYTVPASLLSPTDPAGANGVVPQVELLGLDLDLDPDQVVSAAIHNTDSTGIVQALGELGRRHNVAFDLLTAHGRYHFYTAEVLAGQMDALEAERESAGQDRPQALFGRPTEGGRAATAVADDDQSAAQVFPALTAEGIRYLTPCGLISRREAHFNLYTAAFPAIDRAGSGLTFFRRTLPSCAWEPGGDHERFSRLSTFENRLRHVLDQLDEGRVGVYPIYTHLGQTADLDEPPSPWFGDGVLADLADRYYGAPGPGLRPWLTRASMLANYATMLQAMPDLITRGRDQISIARQRDPVTGHAVPETLNALYGVSFEADNTRRMTVAFDDEPIDDIVRWHERGQVTLVPCPIKWPIVLHDDPAVVAQYPGDLAAFSVTGGDWAWHVGRAGLRGPELSDPAAFGRLVVNDGQSSATVRIELGALDPAGAQVFGANLRKGHGVDRVTVRLHTEGGSCYEIQDLASAMGQLGDVDDRTGTFSVVLRSGSWVESRAPLWGFDWSAPMAPKRRITAIEVVVAGSAGSQVDIAELFLGRPRTTTPHRHSTGPRIGGDAFGHDRVAFRRLDGADAAVCDVASDGLWSSPPVDPGAWLVEVDHGEPAVVQVLSDRYDL